MPVSARSQAASKAGTPRVAAYLRVSTPEQDLDAQRAEIRAYLTRRGWTDPAAADKPGMWQGVVEYAEKATSDSRKRREVFEEVLSAARRREFDVLVVLRLDRWGRSLTQFVNTLDDLQALGVAFVSVAEGHDTTTPGGRALFGMAAVFAEYERALNHERTMLGIRTAKDKGVTFGRPPSVSTTLSPTIVARAVKDCGSLNKAARKLGISPWSVRKALKVLEEQQRRAETPGRGTG